MMRASTIRAGVDGAMVRSAKKTIADIDSNNLTFIY